MKKLIPWKFGIACLMAGLIMGFTLSRFSGIKLLGLPEPAPKPKNSDGSEFSRRQPVSTDLTKLYPKQISRQGNPNLTMLALTFDDGPDLKYTPKILDVLKKYNVKATFFVVGTQIIKYPATFKRMIREGHEIGSHGYQHLKIAGMPQQQIRYHLTKNQVIIKQYGGPSRSYYRPPYGALDPAAIEAIGKQGTKIILWTIDSLDWRGLKKAQVIKNVVPKFKRGYIVLQHSAADSKKEDLTGSIQALPEIIKAAKKSGYRFVTISQLLKETKS